MEVLWNSPQPLKPQDVLTQLEGEYAYTTVMTVLKRMADKDLLNRKTIGKAYFYSPKLDKSTFACEALNDLFDRLFCSYGDQLVASFRASALKHKIKL